QAADFPPELASSMTSLAELSDGRPIDTAQLLDGFVRRIAQDVEALRAGSFDLDRWIARQITTGREVAIEEPDGSTTIALALGVDAETGALVIAPSSAVGERLVHSGEVRHVRVQAERSLAGSAGPGL